jgi:hypothetical protein
MIVVASELHRSKPTGTSFDRIVIVTRVPFEHGTKGIFLSMHHGATASGAGRLEGAVAICFRADARQHRVAVR